MADHVANSGQYQRVRSAGHGVFWIESLQQNVRQRTSFRCLPRPRVATHTAFLRRYISVFTIFALIVSFGYDQLGRGARGWQQRHWPHEFSTHGIVSCLLQAVLAVPCLEQGEILLLLHHRYVIIIPKFVQHNYEESAVPRNRGQVHSLSLKFDWPRALPHVLSMHRPSLCPHALCEVVAGQ